MPPSMPIQTVYPFAGQLVYTPFGVQPAPTAPAANLQRKQPTSPTYPSNAAITNKQPGPRATQPPALPTQQLPPKPFLGSPGFPEQSQQQSQHLHQYPPPSVVKPFPVIHPEEHWNAPLVAEYQQPRMQGYPQQYGQQFIPQQQQSRTAPQRPGQSPFQNTIPQPYQTMQPQVPLPQSQHPIPMQLPQTQPPSLQPYGLQHTSVQPPPQILHQQQVFCNHSY